MRFKVIIDHHAETPDGVIPLEQGQMIELDKDDAIPIIEAGVITPTENVAYRLYSDVLGAFLWVAPDESSTQGLGDVAEPVYIADEVRKLKGLSPDGLRAIHRVKIEFKESRVESVEPVNILTNPEGV